MHSALETEIYTGLYDKPSLEQLRLNVQEQFPPSSRYEIDLEQEMNEKLAQKYRIENFRKFCRRFMPKSDFKGQLKSAPNSECFQAHLNPTEKSFRRNQTAGKQSSLSFLIVREPVLYAIENFFREILIRRHPEMPVLTLSDILMSIYNRHTRDELYPTQIHTCNPCEFAEQIDFVGRIETFGSDYGSIKNGFGDKMKDELVLLENIKTLTTESQKKAIDYLDDINFNQVNTDLLRKLIWIYRFDYLAFGYNPYQILNKTKSPIDNGNLMKKSKLEM